MRTRNDATIEQRLIRLERQNAQLRWLIVLVPAMALVVGAGAGGQGEVAKSIVAEEFILRDAEGKHRASLSVIQGSAALSLRDAAGNNRVTLAGGTNGTGEKDTGPGLFLVNGKGKAVAALYHSNTGGSALTLQKPDGVQLMTAGMNLRTKGGQVSVYDGKGTYANGLDVTPEK